MYHRTKHLRNEAWIPAHFYRKVEHDYSCKYNTVGQVSIIARQSLESFFFVRGLLNVCIKDTERVSFKSRKGMKKEFFE